MAANPPNFHGSILILRPILELYDSAMQTPDFSHVHSAHKKPVCICSYTQECLVRYIYCIMWWLRWPVHCVQCRPIYVLLMGYRATMDLCMINPVSSVV